MQREDPFSSPERSTLGMFVVIDPTDESLRLSMISLGRNENRVMLSGTTISFLYDQKPVLYTRVHSVNVTRIVVNHSLSNA